WDEAGLGTPDEDMTSLAAVSRLSVPQALVMCLGFGIDSYHGVCHAHFLENVAALTRGGGFLGAFSLLPEIPEAQAFLSAVACAQARTPDRPSIVNGSIAAASKASSGTCSSPPAPRGASSSSTRSWPSTSASTCGRWPSASSTCRSSKGPPRPSRS